MPAPGDREVRIKALELTVEHFKGATINASYLTAEQLIQRAAKLEAFIKNGAG